MLNDRFFINMHIYDRRSERRNEKNFPTTKKAIRKKFRTGFRNSLGLRLFRGDLHLVF